MDHVNLINNQQVSTRYSYKNAK